VCCNEVKKCDYCGNEFSKGDNIFCVDEKKHFCSYSCFIKWFEEEYEIIATWVEEEEK